MFGSVLVANRGEIAVRIIRTLRSLGVRSVAIYSEADRDALHVEYADEAVLVGPAEARSSYLDIDRVVAAAVSTSAQAVHPGYGFLSENADFAQACERAGLVFIGPDSRSIRLMGDKRAAKDLVAALGVPVVPGFHEVGADDDRLVAACTEIGFPVIVKPSAGGGGKGMRVVHESSEVLAALASSRREAMSAFGDDTLLLEKYVPRARHVEVQVLGDGAGEVVHLGDRDCSLQRRHQKVVEEAPAPHLPDDVRDRMRADAVAIARSARYRGVGTVEYVVDADDPSTYYFLEMNTRLQVEHPVTEVVTGLDLVALQLHVAATGTLPLTQDDVRITGHAVEARVYAEDGHHGFLPSSGTVLSYREPAAARTDSGIREGSVVGTSYDPLLLKVVGHGDDRTAALDALDTALAGTVVLGIAHNVGALRLLLADPLVRSAAMTTSLIGELDLTGTRDDRHRAVAAALVLRSGRESGDSPWTSAVGWRVGAPAPVTCRLVDDDGDEITVRVLGPVADCTVSVDDDAAVPARLRTDGAGTYAVTVDGVTRRYAGAVDDNAAEHVVWVGVDGGSWAFRVQVRTTLRRPGDAEDEGGELRSPMPGTVIAVAKSAGDPVREGEVVATVEAMKMEYPITSPVDGTVDSVAVAVGAQVVRNQVVGVVRAAGAA